MSPSSVPNCKPSWLPFLRNVESWSARRRQRRPLHHLAGRSEVFQRSFFRFCRSCGVSTLHCRGLRQHPRPRKRRAAFLGARSGHRDEAHDCHASCSRGCLSLLRAGAAAINPLGALPSDLARFVAEEGGLLRHEDAAYAELKEVGNACALDPMVWIRVFDFGWLLKELARELEVPEFFGHQLQTAMTRATVEDRTAGLGQIGQLFVIHTTWVAIRVVGSVAPTLSTAQERISPLMLRSKLGSSASTAKRGEVHFIKNCETVVGCGKRSEKSDVWVILVTPKKRSQRPVSILVSKKLREIQAGPGFRMVKKRQAVNNDTDNIPSDTTGERWATISPGIMCGILRHVCKLR